MICCSDIVLSPSKCVSHNESPTGAALALFLHNCYHLDTALRPIQVTWMIQNATIALESFQCVDQLAHVLGFVSKIRTLTLFLCRIRELIHFKRGRWTLLVLTHDLQHVLVSQNFGRLSISRLFLPQLRLPSLLLDLTSCCHLGVDEIN